MSRETAIELYTLTKLEEAILTKIKITGKDIHELGELQEKYAYGWHILEQTPAEQLLSVMEFKKYILDKNR